MTAHPDITTDRKVTLVTFGVGDLHCGLPIDEVDEIKRVFSITRVHLAPRNVSGVVNIRGQIVTVIDLQKQLCLENDEPPEHRKMVIIRKDFEQIGLLVDFIDDTIITPPPNLDDSLRKHVRYVCKTADTLIAVLDVKAITSKVAGYENDLSE